MSRKGIGSYKTCGCCEKQFYMGGDINLRTYTYKIQKKNMGDWYTFFCSYTCWRKISPEGAKRYKRM